MCLLAHRGRSHSSGAIYFILVWVFCSETVTNTKENSEPGAHQLAMLASQEVLEILLSSSAPPPDLNPGITSHAFHIGTGDRAQGLMLAGEASTLLAERTSQALFECFLNIFDCVVCRPVAYLNQVHLGGRLGLKET